MMVEKLSKTLFYTIVLLLPLNIGYHFVINEAYIGGLLIDYLIPTLYIQDILIAGFLTLNFKEFIKMKDKPKDKYLIWFLFAVFLATISSMFVISSFASFARLILYAGFMLVVKAKYSGKEYFKKVVKIFGVSILLLSILAFLQWFEQGSVFNNYLFFGEQPYTSSTPGINIENFFGYTKVPPYALFKHPNIFGGILSIVLVWFLKETNKSKLLKIAFVVGLIALFLTLSKFAWVSFGIGVSYYHAHKHKCERVKILVKGFVIVAIVLSLFLPFFPGPRFLLEKPSFYRRADLLDSSYKLISQKPLFGIGYGISTAYIDKFLPPKHDVRFAQPPHNMFVLLFAEAGVFAFMSFTLFLFKKIKKAYEGVAGMNNSRNNFLFISILQILFLGVFDHYFFTIHQPQLLFWLILGFI